MQYLYLAEETTNLLDNYFIGTFCFQVTYQTEYFIDKNKDYVVAEHQALLTASACPFVSNLFPHLREDSAKSSKFSSIGSQFKVPFCSSFSLCILAVIFFFGFMLFFFLFMWSFCTATTAIFARNTKFH